MPLTNAEKQRKYRKRQKEKKLQELAKANAEDILKLSIIEFFRKVTKLEPTEKQKEVLVGLENPNLMNILISSGRQTGKSLCCAVAAIYLTLKNKVQICLVSAKENYVFAHITDIFSNNPELTQFIAWQGVAHVIPKEGYELKNGSKVLLLSSSEKGIRGASASILFLDEAELMPSETVSTAYGNISGKNIKLVVLGTPSSHYSKFNELLKYPERYNFKLFTWSELDCLQWHTKEELDNKRKIFTTEQWNTDVLGILSESNAKLLWDTEQIDKCIQNSVFTEGGQIECGIDGGGTGVANRDKLALTIIERIGKYKTKIRFCKTWGFDEIKKAPEDIGQILREYRPVIVKVDSLPVFWTDLVKEHYDKNKVFSVTMKNFKEEMIGKLSHVIESQGLEIPLEYEDLIAELKSYKKQGNPHFDDLVDSLLLANFFNEELFPVKPSTGGRIIIHNMNTGETCTNFGIHITGKPRSSMNFVPIKNINRKRKGLFGHDRTKAEKVLDDMREGR